MKLKEYLMVVCRNAGRCFGIANRSDFYRDFLRSLYDKDDYPAFYNDKVACLKYYARRLGRLPSTRFNDESKEDRYIYYYDPERDLLASITIKEVIMNMYDPENAFQYAQASLRYTCAMFELFKGHLREDDLVSLTLALGAMDFSKYSGDEPVEEITDPALSDLIAGSMQRRDLFGIDRPQDRIERKRTRP